MSRLPDLVLDSRLRTKFNGSFTIHSYLEVDDTGRRFFREEHWKWDRFLGRGGFGQVRLQGRVAQDAKQDALRAVKLIHKLSDPSGSLDFNRELETIAKFSNDRYKRWFVKSFGWFEDSSSIFITMEYCRHGDLHGYLRGRVPISAGEVQQLTFQILEGLHQMHQNDFAHRDLKPGNILIKSMPPGEKWWVVLADFGISKRADEGNGPTTAIKGTTTFMAPELQGYLESVKPKTITDFKATDMWALGEIIFQMLTSQVTFQSPIDLMKYCIGQKSFPSDRLAISALDDSCEFVTRIMAVLPKDRMTTAQCIQHRWMEPLRVDEEFATLDLEEHDAPIPETSSSEPASARWTALSDLGNTTMQMTVKRKPVNPATLTSPIPERHEQETSKPSEAADKQFTLTEVAEHNTMRDLYIVVHDKVYDVTSFANMHPGGEEVLLDVSGKDATEVFEEIGHSNKARETLASLLVGTLKREKQTMSDHQEQIPVPHHHDSAASTFAEDHEQRQKDSTEGPRSSPSLSFIPSNNSMPRQDVISNSVPAKTTPSSFTRDLKSAWKKFSRRNNKQDEEAAEKEDERKIFGVPFTTSIPYANVAISLFSESGETYIYGYIPIIVAKCAVFLKEKGTELEEIFRRQSSGKILEELKVAFDRPPKFGKTLDWAGYTPYDAANILKLYLNLLPEPIIPFQYYELFRRPLYNHQAEAVGPYPEQTSSIGGLDPDGAVRTYQQLIRDIPALHRQLFLYMLDALAVFASKAESNKMDTNSLATIFQPCLLSHPMHDAELTGIQKMIEIRLSCDVLIFLIENQDHFLLGMEGTTAVDEKTAEHVETN